MTFIHGNELGRMVRRWTSAYSWRWFNASGNPPVFLRPYTQREQRQYEQRLDSLKRQATTSLKSGSLVERTRGRRRIMNVVAQELGGEKEKSVKAFLDACGHAGEQLVDQARAFDPGISDDDLHQALKNLWVFNSLQYYLGKHVCVTPSSFAYSLLYPRTDNWLDAGGEKREGKQALLRWLSLELKGDSVSSNDPRKKLIAALLRMIRREHRRSMRPDVHQSLLAIHRAQEKSLRLCGRQSGSGEHHLVPLTIEKGGTSVLADGFLAGRLNTMRAEAIFGYGVLLQLVDDVQDLDEDMGKCHSTPFSRAVRHGTLEGITNRLFNLTHGIAGLFRSQEVPGDGVLSAMVEKSCTILIQEAIARNARFYRRGYLSLVNRLAPVRLASLRELRAR